MENRKKIECEVIKSIVSFSLLFILINASLVAQRINPLLKKPLSYHPNTVVVKLEKSNSNLRTSQSTHQIILENLKVREIKPLLNRPANGRLTDGASGLSRIYLVKLEEGENVTEAVQKLNRMEGIEYAELLPQNHLLYIPNDPQANPTSGNQFHLTNINAYNGWTIEKGDTNIVIGIVDTGVDIDHPDLLPNIAFNYADPVNGIDDDSDGYVDNYMGWDISDIDNNPNTDGNGHGNIVTGVSSAKTDNGIGLAGVGFNTRFLPIKILENSSGNLVNEYEGVLYAANYGCQVINLSWGGPWNYSEFGQDVINYAVLDRNAVVVSAAGNTPDEIDFYPASFNNVLSVTASDASDNFTSWATYSYCVDMMAPGQSIYSANKNGGYSNGGNGTSYAAPMVAGAAALVRSKYPNMDARQVMEQLRIHTDDVYNIGNNNNYFGQIGKGKLNVAKALSDTTSPSIRVLELSQSGKYGEYIFPGDTIDLNATFVNYLSDASSLEIELSVEDNNASANPFIITANNLGTYQSIGTEESWKVVVGNDLDPYSRLLFKADMSAGNYSDFEYFQLYTTPWFFDVESSSLSLTIASDGDLGYDRDSLLWGHGFWSGFSKISDHMGIIISRNNNYLADNVVYDYNLNARDQDFTTLEYARMYDNSNASLDARSSFEESDQVNKQGIQLEQKILGWNDLPDNDFFVLEYRIVNVSDSTLDNLNLSMYTDWDIQNKLANQLEYNSQNGIAYAYDASQNNLFAGISLLSEGDTSFYAIDKDSQNGHISDFDSLFTDSLKIAYSQSDFVKKMAGNLSGGNNVASVMGLRDLDLMPGESKKLAFILMSGNSPERLDELLARARERYDNYLNSPPLEDIFYTCNGDSATINYVNDQSFEIFSDAAMTNLLDSGQVFKSAALYEDTLFYTIKITGGIRQDIRTTKVEIRDPVADFSAYTDTLLISNETLDTITFFSQSVDAFNFNWDLGNGYFSSVKDPKTQYNSPGDHLIRLIIENDIGCADTIEKSLIVHQRIEKPLVGDQVICKGESAVIQAANTNLIRVYDSDQLTNIVFEGASYSTEILNSATDFYVTNTNGVESLPVNVTINVSKPQLSFTYQVDTLDLQNKYVLKIDNTSGYAESISWEIEGGLYSGETVNFNYEGLSDFSIALSGQDSLNCRDTLTINTVPDVSQPVLISDTLICINEAIKIDPSGGELFYFYQDGSFNNPIHKGKNFQTGAIKSDTTFYVTCVDNLLEGPSSVMEVTLRPLKAIIGVQPDSLDLSKENTIVLEDLSEDATLSYWLLPTGGIDMRKSIEMEVTDEGEYFFTLVAENGENCIDTAYSSVKAYLVTGTDDPINSVNIFPNPVQSVLNIYSPEFSWEKMELLDETGKRVYAELIPGKFINETELNITHLPNGNYLLRLQAKDQAVIYKIIIRH